MNIGQKVRELRIAKNLTQEELADSLGYSRIPIREALQILESQGLVKRLATRHVVVADFSDDVIEEIYELLSDVEIKLIRAMMKSGVPLWQEICHQRYNSMRLL